MAPAPTNLSLLRAHAVRTGRGWSCVALRACQLLAVLCQAPASAALGSCNPPQPTPQPNHDGLVSALLAGLEIYDRSIRSLEWDEAVFQALRPGAWVQAFGRQAGVQRNGDWYARAEHPSFAEDPGYPRTSRTYWFGFGRDERLFGAHLDLMTGSVIRPDNDSAAATSPLHLLGRFTDFRDRRPLHALLESAADLQSGPPTPDEPWPLVQGLGCV